MVIVLVAGGFWVFHKPSKNNNNTNANSASQNSKNNAPAVNNAVLVTKTASSVGQYLADPSGKPLYTYGADTSGKSNCTGSCLSIWPAYQAKSTSNLPAGVGVITRSDNGQKQYTYNGLPLYFFVSDTNGQVTGNNVQNFQVAKPAAASSMSSSSSSTNNQPSSSSSQTNSSSSYPY